MVFSTHTLVMMADTAAESDQSGPERHPETTSDPQVGRREVHNAELSLGVHHVVRLACLCVPAASPHIPGVELKSPVNGSGAGLVLHLGRARRTQPHDPADLEYLGCSGRHTGIRRAGHLPVDAQASRE